MANNPGLAAGALGRGTLLGYFIGSLVVGVLVATGLRTGLRALGGSVERAAASVGNVERAAASLGNAAANAHMMHGIAVFGRRK